MKNYELTYLVSPDLTDSELEDLNGKVANFIREKDGSVSAVSTPSKIKLGYKIGKKEDAFMASCYFSAEQSRLAEIKTFIESQTDVLRHIIVIKKKIKEPIIRIERPKVSISTEAKIEESKESEEINKKIDEKIDEILN